MIFLILLIVKIQIMNSLFKQKGEQLANKLKIKKTEIMNQEQSTKNNIELYYSQLRNIVDQAQHQASIHLNREVLRYYETSADVIKKISKNEDRDSQEDIQQANSFLEYRINDSPAISLDKLSKIIEKSYQITISSQPQSQSIDFLREFLQESQANSVNQNMHEIVIQKLQCERDYYKNRQSELQNRIKDLETGLSKRGVNIKEMSRSYLEEKCSKWALERLTQQKKILVQRIGEASQQILRLNTEVADLQHQIKRMTGSVYDANSRSMVGNSSIKINSIVEETRHYQRILENQERKERQSELQIKNQQLMFQVTRCMRQIQDLSQANTHLQSLVQEDQQKLSSLTQIIESLKETNESLNHDYEISLKRKATFEQQCKQLKLEIQRLTQSMNEQRQAYKTMISELQHRQEEVVLKVKSIEQNKKVQYERYEEKIRAAIEEKDKVMRMVEENTAKKGEEMNYKALLNDQITRLLKENTILGQQISLKEQKGFQDSLLIKKLTSDCSTAEGKAQQLKKQSIKLKKHCKEQDKQISELQRHIEERDNLQIKAAHLQQNYHILLSEFSKYKEASERKGSVQDRTLNHLKEKFNFQLSALLNEDAKGKNKKSNQKVELVEKYVQEMAALSAKTSQIKQLKEELRELKEGKQQKSHSKKLRSSSVDETVASLQAGIITLGTNIMNQRIKTEKDLNEESLKELQQIIAKDQTILKSLQEELQSQRQNVIELKKAQKQESLSQDKSKQLRQKEQKIQRLQIELKISRSNCIKLQNQNNQLQSELKTKKDLSAGLKKQCKEKDELIKQIKTELSITQDQLQKLKRNQKEVSKKQNMFKDYKQKKQQIKEENISLKRTIDTLQEKIKLLNKQIAKKDESLKQVRNVEEKQIKIKEEGKLKQAYETISSHKETIRKLKMEVQRKDQIIRNTKEKAEMKVRELEGRATSKQKESEKNKKDLELFERKIQSAKGNYKREENRNYILTVMIKKIFELCINQQREEPQRSSNNRESVQYYSTSTPHQIKQNNASSQFLRSNDICEGLRILDLKPQDFEGLMGETTISSKVSNLHQETSWSMVSPIICKSSEAMKQQQLISGLQQLQKQLLQKQLNTGSVLQLFKRVLRAQ